MAEGYLQEVRCRSCHRTTALALRNFAVYCDEICVQEPAPAEREDRDAVIEILFHAGDSHAVLAEKFGLTRQRIHQILAKA